MIGGRSLRRRLAMLTSLGFGAVWLGATLLMAFVLHAEQEEMLDLTLRETAVLFQPVLLRAWQDGQRALPHSSAPADPGEDLVYVLQDRDGTIFVQSMTAQAAVLPDGPPQQGYRSSATHVFFTAAPDANGLFVTFGDPKAERAEAFRDSLLGFFVPMLAMLPLSYLLVSWIVQTALRPLGALRLDIALRDEGRLDPLDTADLPQELREITAGFNGLMARLGTALEGERAFATNAAHELRTPVAIALAQVQRLRAETADPQGAARIDRVEAALTRMSHLVRRLLQLARADAGIGAGRTGDLVPLLRHVLTEGRGDPARAGRLSVTLPDGPVPALVDADAWAIVAGNLIDNAFLHGQADTPVCVALSASGRLTVENTADALEQSHLKGLIRRFHRGAGQGAGFGLGLHIADAIARQAGGTLTLDSRASRDAGALFVAVFDVPAGYV